jgi:hypothetical protein
MKITFNLFLSLKYLEKRFDRNVKLMASIIFIVQMVGKLFIFNFKHSHIS